MSRNLARIGLVLATILMFAPAVARAQSGIAGVVKDTSGAILPGVTVEAASPALIEGVRTAVTDGNGQYKIVDLRPGLYSVTFSVTGFTTVKREGIQLPASFTATVNAELAVGSVQETITVAGASPVVDVQSATQQLTLTRSGLDALPTGRNIFAQGQLLAGSTTARPDVGGSEGMQSISLNVHGSNGDTNYVIDGLKMEAIESSTTYLN